MKVRFFNNRGDFFNPFYRLYLNILSMSKGEGEYVFTASIWGFTSEFLHSFWAMQFDKPVLFLFLFFLCGNLEVTGSQILW